MRIACRSLPASSRPLSIAALEMIAVQYLGLATDPPRYPSQRPSPLADHVIDDLATLPKVLGIA